MFFFISVPSAIILSTIWIDASIIQSFIIIEFSIVHFSKWEFFPILTFGPITADDLILEFSSIITGEIIFAPDSIVQFFPIKIPLLWLSFILSRINWLAWRISFGVPVSFHQPVT